MPLKGKIVATIQARLGSSRLPRKGLKQIIGQPMIELMIKRVSKAQSLDEIILATSVNPQDDELALLAQRMNIKCYRGSENDVLKRILEAAQSLNAEHLVQLWGDNPLLDPHVIDYVVNYYKAHHYDCVGTSLDKNFPLGMSLLVFPVRILEAIDKISTDPVDREHGSNHIYEHPEKYALGHIPCPPAWNRPEIRLTVDEPADFQLVSTIFENLYPQNPFFGIEDIIKFLDSQPSLLTINGSIEQRKVRI